MSLRWHLACVGINLVAFFINLAVIYWMRR